MGDVSQLGAEVMGCFGAAIAAAALKVTRGVIAARRGFEELAANVVSLQEAIKLLPSELFRTCLAKVRMSRETIYLMVDRYRLHHLARIICLCSNLLCGG